MCIQLEQTKTQENGWTSGSEGIRSSRNDSKCTRNDTGHVSQDTIRSIATVGLVLDAGIVGVWATVHQREPGGATASAWALAKIVDGARDPVERESGPDHHL